MCSLSECPRLGASQTIPHDTQILDLTGGWHLSIQIRFWLRTAPDANRNWLAACIACVITQYWCDVYTYRKVHGYKELLTYTLSNIQQTAWQQSYQRLEEYELTNTYDVSPPSHVRYQVCTIGPWLFGPDSENLSRGSTSAFWQDVNSGSLLSGVICLGK